MTTATRRPVASVSMESVVHLVDQDARTRDRLHRLMRGAGLPCRTYRDADSLLLHLDDDRPGCVLVALHTSGKAGLRIQRSLGESGFTLPVIFLSHSPRVSVAVHAMREGAEDFLTAPTDNDALIETVHQAIARDRRTRRHRVRSPAPETRP